MRVFGARRTGGVPVCDEIWLLARAGNSLDLRVFGAGREHDVTGGDVQADDGQPGGGECQWNQSFLSFFVLMFFAWAAGYRSRRTVTNLITPSE